MAANLQLDSQQSTALGVAELYIIIKRFRYRSKINRQRFYFSSDAQPKLVGSSALPLPALCHLYDTFAWIEVKLIFPVVDSLLMHFQCFSTQHHKREIAFTVEDS